MSAVTEFPRDAATFRFVDVCPRCGYSLVGSPDEGNCPECGAAYDQQIMILHGDGAGKLEHLGNGSERRFWAMALLVVWLAYVVTHQLPKLFLTIAAAWSALMLLIYWLRRSRKSPGLVRVYLSPRGYLQRDRIPFHPIFRMDGVRNLLIVAGVAVVVLIQDWLQPGIALMAAAVGLIYLLWREIRFPAMDAEPIPLADGALEGHPWTGVERCTCKLKKDGRIHLRIWLPGRGLAESVSLVEIEFVGDPMRRLHVDLLVQKWIADAKEPRREGAEMEHVSPIITEAPADHASTRMVDVCSECGYSLAGSPEEGNCPECGASYDQQVMILHGNGTGKHQHVGNIGGRQLWATAFLSLYPLYLVLRSHPALFLPVSLGWLGFVSLLVWRRRASTRPGLVHVYLSPRGFWQVDEIRLPAVFHPIALNLLLLAGVGGVMIWMDGGSVLLVGIGLIAAAMVLIHLLWKEVKHPPTEPLLIPLTDGTLKGHPWTGAEGFNFETRQNGQVFFSIWGMGRGLPEWVSVVEIELACDPARQQQISALVHDWIKQAGRRRATNGTPA